MNVGLRVDDVLWLGWRVRVDNRRVVVAIAVHFVGNETSGDDSSHQCESRSRVATVVSASVASIAESAAVMMTMMIVHRVLLIALG